MTIEINNFLLKKEIEAVASKSFEQRVICASLLSDNYTIINNCGESEDVIALRKILRQFNCEILKNESTLKISNKNIIAPEKINSNESAFIARVFPPIMSLFRSNFEITGQKSLLKREIIKDFNIFKEKKWVIESNNNNLPAKFINARLLPGKYIFDNINTSQIITGLIFALLKIEEDSTIEINNVVSLPYIYLTIEVLKLFNVRVDIEKEGKKLIIIIKKGQKIIANDIKIEGDWSSATNLIVFSLLKGDAIIKGLNKNSHQADKSILDIIEMANGKFFFKNDELVIKQSNMRAFEFDITHCPDIFPALIVLALFSEGKSKIYGIDRLKNKESSRGEVLFRECQKIGAKIEKKNGFFEIVGKNKYTRANFNSYNDHRVAMSEIVISAIMNNKSTLSNIVCIKKSCPNFLNFFIKDE